MVLLFWFASRYLRRALAGPGQVRARGDITPRRAFTSSLAILATNPKALTIWLTILAIFQVTVAQPADLDERVGPRLRLKIGCADHGRDDCAGVLGRVFGGGGTGSGRRRSCDWICRRRCCF